MITIADNTCDFCGACVSVCPPDCIEIREADIEIDEETCIDCNLCVYVCPLEVLSSDDSPTD
ncbi:MAG: 4Fe-4S dicluster domain-containing protein [FCB group bacterium]|nr:4Fe-4S dicluster domain-containing protein [FCB group bacterium]